MTSQALLTVDDQEISLRDCMRYLQSSGKLQDFIGGILRQHILQQETETRTDLEIPEGVVEQAIIDFRLQQQLSDAKAFQEWLQKNGSDYSSFHKQIAGNFKVEKLKMVVSEDKVQEYFIERKLFLDRVILSRIIVDDKDLAEELKTQIQEASATYEDVFAPGTSECVSTAWTPGMARASLASIVTMLACGCGERRILICKTSSIAISKV